MYSCSQHVNINLWIREFFYRLGYDSGLPTGPLTITQTRTKFFDDILLEHCESQKLWQRIKMIGVPYKMCQQWVRGRSLLKVISA